MAVARGEAECWDLRIMLLSPSKPDEAPQIGRRGSTALPDGARVLGDLLGRALDFSATTLCQRTYR
jgi:hypothetical protein